MTYDELQGMSAEKLEGVRLIAEQEIDKIRCAYLTAANREAADLINTVRMVDTVYRMRSYHR